MCSMKAAWQDVRHSDPVAVLLLRMLLFELLYSIVRRFRGVVVRVFDDSGRTRCVKCYYGRPYAVRDVDAGKS